MRRAVETWLRAYYQHWRERVEEPGPNISRWQLAGGGGGSGSNWNRGLQVDEILDKANRVERVLEKLDTWERLVLEMRYWWGLPTRTVLQELARDEGFVGIYGGRVGKSKYYELLQELLLYVGRELFKSK